MKVYDPLITRNFDVGFSHLESQGILQFFPWVGCDYEKSRLAIISKWHYFTDPAVKDSDREYTRRIVSSEGIGKNQNPYKEALSLLFLPLQLSLEERRRFWSHVAFFNLSKEQKDPNCKRMLSAKDFDAFDKISNILLPTHCVFTGVELGKYNTKTLLNNLGISTTCQTSFHEHGMFVEVATLSKGSWSTIAVFANTQAMPSASPNSDCARNYLPKFF